MAHWRRPARLRLVLRLLAAAFVSDMAIAIGAPAADRLGNFGKELVIQVSAQVGRPAKDLTGFDNLCNAFRAFVVLSYVSDAYRSEQADRSPIWFRVPELGFVNFPDNELCLGRRFCVRESYAQIRALVLEFTTEGSQQMNRLYELLVRGLGFAVVNNCGRRLSILWYRQAALSFDALLFDAS